MNRLEHLSVPYITVVESVPAQSNLWRVVAAHPELPGCSAEADTAEEAIEALDDVRFRYILDRLDRHEDIPTPRAPLRERIEWLAGQAATGDSRLRGALGDGDGPRRARR